MKAIIGFVVSLLLSTLILLPLSMQLAEAQTERSASLNVFCANSHYLYKIEITLSNPTQATMTIIKVFNRRNRHQNNVDFNDYFGRPIQEYSFPNTQSHYTPHLSASRPETQTGSQTLGTLRVYSRYLVAEFALYPVALGEEYILNSLALQLPDMVPSITSINCRF